MPNVVSRAVVANTYLDLQIGVARGVHGKVAPNVKEVVAVARVEDTEHADKKVKYRPKPPKRRGKFVDVENLYFGLGVVGTISINHIARLVGLTFDRTSVDRNLNCIFF